MKKSKLFVMILLMVMVMAACNNGASTGNPDANQPANQEGSETGQMNKLDQIKAKGVLVMGTSADYPPYESHLLIDGQDQIVGFDIDIAKEIAKEIGVELQIEDMDFEGLLVSLETNKIDMVIAGMSATEERAKSVDFSKVYYNPNQKIIVKQEDASSLNSLDAFQGLAIGVQKGTIQEDFVDDNMPEAQKNALAKIPNLIIELKSGKTKGVVLEEPVAKAYAAQNPDLVVADINVEISNDGGSSIAVKKGEKDLLEVIDTVIQKLIDQGKIDQFVLDANELMNQE